MVELIDYKPTPMGSAERGVMILFKRPQSREGEYEEFIKNIIEGIFGKELTQIDEEIKDEVEGRIESVLDDGELCYCLILPNGYAYGARSGVEIYGNMPPEIPLDKEERKKLSNVHINWEVILEYRKLDGTICERNYYLCRKCFSLDTVMSDNGIFFCKRCGFSWKFAVSKEDSG